MGAIESDGASVGPGDATQGGAPGPTGSGRHGTPGQRLGPYEILGELGRGGMGVVYRARHATLGSDVALKVIIQGRDAEPDAVKRFIREAKAAAQLAGHPGIVGVHDIGEFDGRVYFAMDLIEGASLEKLIDEQRVTPQQAAGLIEQAARAVHHAHQHGILHRDLKPANILVTTDGRARVTDFGLAQVRAAGPEASRLTKSGQVLGTPAYMSPEQAESGSLDARADVWSLGATLYEALVGEPPFPGDTIYNVLAKVLRADPVPPRKRDPRVPRELETITLKCLEKPAERRYPTAEALAEDLARWTKGEAILARPPGAVERAGRWVRRRRAVVATAAAVGAGAAVVVGVTVVPWWREASARAQAEAAGRADRQAALERKDAAQPFLDKGREILARLDRLLGQPDWTAEQAGALARAARKEFAEALKADLGSAEASLAVARAHALLGQREAALNWCDRALAAEPRFAPALLERGLLRLADFAATRQGRDVGTLGPETAAPVEAREAAEADLKAVERAGGAAEEMAYANGLREFAVGRWESAGEQLEAFARMRLTDPRAWRWAGQAWANAKGWARALPALDEAVRLRPRDGFVLNLRGAVRKESGDLVGALADLDAALALEPRYVPALVNRGQAKYAVGDLAAAIADYDAALALDSRRASALYNRGRAKNAIGDRAGAIADYDAALSLDPRSVTALVNRGQAKAASGDIAGAIADYDAALAVDPRDAIAFNNRGAAKQNDGDPAGAIADYDAALSLDPRYGFALVNRGRAKRAVGDLSGAIADYDAALALDPRDAAALHHRGNARQAAGDLAGAIADFDAALARDSRHPAALYARANAKQDAGDLAGAITDYDAALALEPGFAEAIANRGISRLRQGDPTGAAADLARALALAPPDWPHRAGAEFRLAQARAALSAQGTPK